MFSPLYSCLARVKYRDDIVYSMVLSAGWYRYVLEILGANVIWSHLLLHMGSYSVCHITHE